MDERPTTERMLRRTRNAFLLQGGLLILLGIVIAVAPAVLVALVSVAFLLLGAASLYTGWRLHERGSDAPSP